jgi:4-amino-4-deoxy-L-arabinose transferase-like glycosyltransferase
MMLFEWVRAHAGQGLKVTKGYNLSTKWSLAPSQVKRGTHNVYVSAPPLEPLLAAAVYTLCGQHFSAVRVAPVLLGLVYLYSCVILGIKYLTRRAQVWLLYFVLSPMLLIYSSQLEINASNLGFLVLAYVCCTNYLETGARRWMMWAGLSYLLGFWISYMAFAVVPPILIQLWLDRGFPWSRRRQALLLWMGFVAVGFCGAAAHLALLPGAVSWALGRAMHRFSASSGGVTGADISLVAFVVRQTIRMVTHYTPICVVLAGVSLLIAVRRRKPWSGSRREDGSCSVSPAAVLFQVFFWGVPAGVLAINHAYVHPFSLYYFAIFMAFGSALGLDWITEWGKHVRGRRILANGVVAVFLTLSIGRSLFTLTGGSLPALSGGRLPAWVTTGLGAADRVHGDPVIPSEQW